jgi:hypothetical protein
MVMDRMLNNLCNMGYSMMEVVSGKTPVIDPGKIRLRIPQGRDFNVYVTPA